MYGNGCLSSRGHGGSCHVKFCQPLVQSPSWSWLPIVEAPGCLGHLTSHRATQLFNRDENSVPNSTNAYRYNDDFRERGPWQQRVCF